MRNINRRTRPADTYRQLPFLTKNRTPRCLVLNTSKTKSYEEISDILKIPENTVASRLSRAKQAFKTLAENTFDLSILNKI
ncbi:MAG: hypothetical protein IPG79_18525 [Saprospiraceae bacterium]|nr:hypothetical protein [Saprospiraceae bacterium]